MFHEDAFVVRNSTLRESIAKHRNELLAFYLKVRDELQVNRNSTKYGRAFTNRSVFLKPAVNKCIDAIVAKFRDCLHNYEINAVELWLGGGGRENATVEHNDAALYIRSGVSVRMQFWVLLEACLLNKDRTSIEKRKGALECLVPVAPGPLFPMQDMNAIWTPSGCVAYREVGIVGGDDVGIGDVVAFRNGVIHRADGGDEDMFRAALCFRAELKEEQEGEELDYALCFREFLRNNKKIGARLADNPYFANLKSTFLDCLPEVSFDSGRLAKKDRNNSQWLNKQIETFEFVI